MLEIKNQGRICTFKTRRYIVHAGSGITKRDIGLFRRGTLGPASACSLLLVALSLQGSCSYQLSHKFPPLVPGRMGSDGVASDLGRLLKAGFARSEPWIDLDRLAVRTLNTESSIEFDVFHGRIHYLKRGSDYSMPFRNQQHVRYLL